MKHDNYIDGVLREQWDDATRTYTAWDESGVQTGQRPYTAQENTAADTYAETLQTESNKSTIETNLANDLVAMQAILDQTNANLRADPSQEIKDIATAVRRLTKRVLEDYSVSE